MPPPRSLLYMPASNARAIEKARSLACDAVILDLEDAVAPESKSKARAAAVAAVREGFGARTCIIRINARETPWATYDLAAAARARPSSILIPKIETAADLDWAVGQAGGVPVWAMIETPRAVFAAAAIARTAGALVAGLNDLALALGARPGAARAELSFALQATLCGARAGGAWAFDGVPLALDDMDGVAAECAQARALGFDGKTLVHPAQIGPCNRAFASAAEEVAAAAALIAAWEARGPGVAVVAHAGRLVEALHVEAARRVLARADAPR